MKTNFQKIEFFDREREKQEILHIIETEPNLINFIYGPINSGKTALIINIIENLPENYVVFYINLRERPISTYHDFLEVIFDVKYEGILAKIKRFFVRKKTTFNDLISDLGKIHGIPIPKGIFSRIFKEEKPENAFVYILNLIKDAKSNKKIPILIVDELQTISDLKVNEHLIYKLFNFFIHLTKELHLCHVFALSSDSLFIEKIYNEAALKERCQYILVDEFDEETTKKFLGKYGINKEECNTAWNCLGGKPGVLISFINTSNRKVFVEDLLTKRKGDIEELVFSLKDKNKDMFEKVINVLENFKNTESVKYKYVTEEIRFLVSENIIFADPSKKIIKAQSKSDLLAIREILKEIKYEPSKN